VARPAETEKHYSPPGDTFVKVAKPKCEIRPRDVIATRRLARRMTGLIAARAAQREGFERGQLTVTAHHVIVGDFDRGEVAGM
jgi:hypothetical protein